MIKKLFGVFVVMALVIVGLISRADAHVGTTPTITCEKVSADFSSFPNGTHNITFVVGVNGTSSDVASTLTGNAGTASADITSLTAGTGELNISAYAKWTADGGGKTETQEVKLTCHDKVVPPVTPPVTQMPDYKAPVVPSDNDVPDAGFVGK